MFIDALIQHCVFVQSLPLNHTFKQFCFCALKHWTLWYFLQAVLF